MSDLDDFGTSTPPKKDPLDLRLLTPEPLEPRDSKKKETMERIQWSSSGPKMWTAVGATKNTLSPGVYSIVMAKFEIHFVENDIKIDDLLEFPDSKNDSILNEISEFWKRGHLFKKYGFLHRRGYLLYGPAGSGKTSVVQQVMAQIVKNKGIVFLCNHPGIFAEGLNVFRQVEPDRPIVCVYEDIDTIIRQYGDDTLLALLDGEVQVDKVLNIATTNYPENLDKRIVGRPRRFDRVIKIGMPEPAVRRAYFKLKLNIEDNEIDKWVNATHEFSFAAMAELVISVHCLGNDFDKSVETLKRLMVSKVSSLEDGRVMGFGGS